MFDFGFSEMAVTALVALVVTAAAVTAPNYWAPFLSTVETWLADLRASVLASPMPQDERIVIFTVRDSTLAQQPYVSPIDRAMLAETIAAIGEKGPKVIGLDLLFTRPTEPAKDAEIGRAHV